MAAKTRNRRIYGDFFFDRQGAGLYYARPMTDRLPEHIEPLRLARAERVLKGQIPLKRMTRLAELVSAAEGDIEVELAFAIDLQGIARLQGHIVCEVQLHCQRCMQIMPWQIDKHFELAIVESEAEAAQLGPDSEILLLDEQALSVVDMLEDEILLILPIAPRHTTGHCAEHIDYSSKPTAAELEAAVEEKQNPFTVLADLKKGKD